MCVCVSADNESRCSGARIIILLMELPCNFYENFEWCCLTFGDCCFFQFFFFNEETHSLYSFYLALKCVSLIFTSFILFTFISNDTIFSLSLSLPLPTTSACCSIEKSHFYSLQNNHNLDDDLTLSFIRIYIEAYSMQIRIKQI